MYEIFLRLGEIYFDGQLSGKILREANIQNEGAQPEIFQGIGGFVKLGHFDKHFVKNSRKKGSAGKISEFFLLDTLKTTF